MKQDLSGHQHDRQGVFVFLIPVIEEFQKDKGYQYGLIQGHYNQMVILMPTYSGSQEGIYNRKQSQLFGKQYSPLLFKNCKSKRKETFSFEASQSMSTGNVFFESYGQFESRGRSQERVGVELIINWSIIMRFYQNSTVRDRGQGLHRKDSASTRGLLLDPLQPTKCNPAYLYYFNQYCGQILQVSNFLNQELLKNNNLINVRLANTSATTAYQNQGKKDSEDNSTASRKNPSQFNFDRIEPIAERSRNTDRNSPKKRKAFVSDSEESYKPEEDYSRELNGSKVSESKNIPKNYGKAILTFIRKNEEFTSRVLQRLGIDQEDFFQSLKELRTNLNTILQLRSIWMDEQNRYAKAYRILSLQYLRKHSLSYIFNSRVQNFHKHIKYRYKIIKSVSDPLEFTCMKEF